MSLFSSDKKYHAFTLTELLVGMIVSGIVISAVWTTFRVVSNLAQSSLSSVTQVEEISFFKRCFSTDFQNAQIVVWTEKGFSMSFGDREHDVKYNFLSEFVLREGAGRTDTFHAQISDVKSGSEYDSDNIEDVSICDMKCTILINGNKQELVLNRKLSSVDLMKIDD